jgi:hypothetical protein
MFFNPERSISMQKKKVKIIKGSTDILIIAPHGVRGTRVRKDDINTDLLAKAIAEELGCSAIINDSIKRSVCDYNRISKATKDKRFISEIRKVLDAVGPTMVVWIHGLKEKSELSEKAKMKVSGLDCLIGYGQPDNLSAREETATNLETLLQKHGVHAYKTRKKAENYRGADQDNMNQWFQRQEEYKSLDKVQSIQLEFAISVREKDAIENTAKTVAAALSDLARPVQPSRTVAAREPQKAQLIPAKRLEVQIRDSDDIGELKDIHDKAEALRIYVRKAEKGFEKQNQYAEVKIRAERRCGEILPTEIEHGGDRKSESRLYRRTLKDLRISKHQSRCWQAIAQLPEDLFEKHLTKTRETKKELTSAGVYRRAFEFRRAKEADSKPLPGADSVKTPIRIRTGSGDFMNYIDQFNDVAAIITDPPYGKEHLDLFGKLGQFAAKVLKPGGSLLTMAGVYHLPRVLELMKPHLNYYWTIAYHMPAKRVQIQGRKVWCNWKPILWFVNGKYEGPRVKDVLIAAPREKGLHPWQQSEADFGTLIEIFTKPGDLIVDPFYGSGTLGAAAMMRNRDFFGIDIDPKTVETAENRLIDMGYKVVLPSHFQNQNPAELLDAWEKQGNNGGETDEMKANPTRLPDEQRDIPAEPFEENGKKYIPTDLQGVYSVKLKGQKPEEPKEAEASQNRIKKFSGWDKTDIEKPDGTQVEAITPVIISASRHTDLPAFYGEWLMNGLRRGYLQRPMPRNPTETEYISFEKTRLIVFWTKNPQPIFQYLDEIDKMGIGNYFQYTLNDYEAEGYEPNLPPLNQRIEAFKNLSKRIGREKVIWRFDPLILSNLITKETLVDRVYEVAKHLSGHTRKLVISFLTAGKHRKVVRNLTDKGVKYSDFTAADVNFVASRLGQISKEYGIEVATCADGQDLSFYGVGHNKCVDDMLIRRVFNQDERLMSFIGDGRKLKDSGQRKLCGCIVSKDIGEYHTCPHLCLYCYANISEKAVKNNIERIDQRGEMLLQQRTEALTGGKKSLNKNLPN